MPRPRPRYSPARKQLLTMMGLVFVVHAIAITIHKLTDMEHQSRTVRTTFLGVWMVLTVLVVGVYMQRIRAARTAARRR